MSAHLLRVKRFSPLPVQKKIMVQLGASEHALHNLKNIYIFFLPNSGKMLVTQKNCFHFFFALVGFPEPKVFQSHLA